MPAEARSAVAADAAVTTAAALAIVGAAALRALVRVAPLATAVAAVTPPYDASGGGVAEDVCVAEQVASGADATSRIWIVGRVPGSLC